MDPETMDTGGVNTSPRIDQKMKARNAAMRLKHGSPQFKDVLRKRFHNRIKENRGRLFDRLRDVSGSKSGVVTTFIQQELASILKGNFTLYLKFTPLIYVCIIFICFLLVEDWLLRQYDLLVADDNTLQQLWEDAQLVVCPVCRKGNLTMLIDSSSKSINCDHCLMTVPARASIPDVQDRIYTIIDSHSDSGCEDNTNFFISREDASLYAHCNSCPFFDLAI
ncbi:hypothetical protein ONE63_000247 [Megalurothrips usitatus]|uniref:RPA-interacting protein C-terminal domain-containing protein n=1 Tax=Megalurothrips usitatus TaxID=439358 RepID=A0AAV7Y1V9_9NEOP|nr:hypothetical protein ONE63_000247 [Megalurothrips usitatus]